MKNRTRAKTTLAAALLALLATPTAAAELAPAAPAKVEPELAPDNELLARIEALPDNTWMKLPPVKTSGDLAWCGKPDWPNSENMPKFGPGLRGYSLKMAWAADRKRALYCGTHHGVFPITNDVWEYDLAANTWVCVYASDPSLLSGGTVEFFQKNAVFKDGIVQTPRGGQVRAIHTWSGLTYDSDRHRMLWFVPKGRGCTFTDRQTLAKGLGFQDEKELLAKWRTGTVGRYTTTYIWSFDPFGKKWEILTEGVPVFDEGQSAEYIADRKMVWASWGAQLYDPDKKATTDPKAKGKTAGVGEVVAAYDPESKTVVMVSQNKTNTYSFATNEWKVVQDNAIASGADMRSYMAYDLVATKFILDTVDKGPQGQNQSGLYLYDLARNEWTEAKPQGDTAPPGGGGYYDPERNVTVKYTGRDTYVYRCKRAAK